MELANALSALREKAVSPTFEGLVKEKGVTSVTGEAVLVPHFVGSMERGPVRGAAHEEDGGLDAAAEVGCERGCYDEIPAGAVG